MHFDKLNIGETVDSAATYYVSEQEIIEFAKQWDPQPFHISKKAAQKHQIGKLFASSVHTIAIATKLAHSNSYFEIDAVAGLGIDQLKMLKPVFAGETLSLKIELTDKRLSASNPGKGVITKKLYISNQHGELKMTFLNVSLVNVNNEI
ncbi:MaoC/PaaZ C-terminal domain-containing protein [Thalassotalea crassostreae]|uniref:MaoC/PaaZ C-terminal domain-containing protein n=1 Tax=Thalassotalea crassostreae TaxID=1763536 RepID=UPI0008397D21|nr:MaoC/PaaZ C-terminal domain-containing protein [Thalassotalea crassostreae]